MKKLLHNLIQSLPFRIRQFMLKEILSTSSIEEKVRFGKTDIEVALFTLKKHGFLPTVVLDIGAHEGLWSRNTMNIFPGATYFLFEPLKEKQMTIKMNCPFENVHLKNVLLGNEVKEDVIFYSMDSGSSVLEEMSSISRTVINLPMTTLDFSLQAEKIIGPILMKLDVQGFELEVLKGAVQILNQTDVIFLELSMLNYNNKAPLAAEVMSVMNGYGFVLWDITSFFRKSTDNALIQADVIFIKEKSDIRLKANDFKLPFNVIMN